MPEKVYIVGAGPGNSGLITLKGIDALKKADVVIYDFLANRALLKYAKKEAKTIYVGKKGRFRHITQDEINKLIIRHAKRGKTIVRLKGGDPFIFGRGAEEALALAAKGINFEVIPGVTSAAAAPAYAGIPLTHRGVSSVVTFITGQETTEKEFSLIRWDKLAACDTLVILMGWKNLPQIVNKLIENGRAPRTPAAVIRWGTLSKQKTVVGTLSNIAALAKREKILPPVVTVVGDVVSLRKKLNWFESKPLFGKRILVTRAVEQAGGFTGLLEECGAETVAFPTIKVAPPENYRAIDGAIKKLSSYDWAIFTSVNGVKYFFERLYKLGKDVRELKGVKICAIGPATGAAVRERGIGVDLFPKEYKAEGVIEALGKKNIRGKRFLLPRAKVAREVLPDEIKRLGGRIDVATVYRTVKPEKEAKGLRELIGKIDAVAFTSSSTVENFISLFKKNEAEKLLKYTVIACIGPVTAKTAKKNGIKVDIMPEKYTIPALAEAICQYFKGR